ncbi:CocE/NonD family hydrolase C-terminal non-catalytic domain-containing protein [Streptomyces rubiginosohelvolus]|uniref:CocE/NonD family hydrolase C-terminal non-catalytic domain-containing protein n=1 Tax=Streptomyces rubiginosohelvolus TaxID=67362 RepID=UPI00367BB4F6
MAPALSRRGRHPGRERGQRGKRRLRPPPRRGRLRPPIRRGHRGQRTDDPQSPGGHHRVDGPRLFVAIEKWSDNAPVPFEGSYGHGRDRVAQGRLRLALRELDPVLSTPHQPEHTFRTLQPVRDGEEVDVLIPLSSSATRFRAGDSLRLMVAGRYPQPRNPFFGHFPTHYLPTTSGKAVIAWSPGRPSALEIPVIPQG